MIKKFIFKLILKFFDSEIKDFYINEKLSEYKIRLADRQIMESVADLYEFPEFRIFVKLQANKKNYLGRSLLNLKYVNEKEAAIKHAFIKGEAYNISHTLHTLKYINKLYHRKRGLKK